MKFLKEYFIIIIILIFVIYINYLTDKDLKNQIAWMRNGVISIENKIEDDKKTEAKNEFDLLRSKWNDITEHLELFVDHSELEKISSDIVRIDANFETDGYEELMENIYDLKFMLKHIEEKNQLKLKNFF